MNCFSCKKYDHITINCPLIRYVPDKSAIIKRHTLKNIQMRQPGSRKKQKIYNALYSKEILSQKITAFQNKNEAFLENYEKSFFLQLSLYKKYLL